MTLIEQIVARAQDQKQRIVLPEGTEERTLKAADKVLADGVADLVILLVLAEAHGKGLVHVCDGGHIAGIDAAGQE